MIINRQLAAPVVACLAAVLGPFSASAQSVNWGTHIGAQPLAFDSRGRIDSGVLIWELGWFDDGFIPSAANAAQWSGHWHRVDVGSYRSSGAWWGVSGHVPDVGSAAAGKQMHVFAHNGMEKVGTIDGEVLLFRQDGLRFPDVLGFVNFDIDDAANDLGDDAFTVIWGRVDRKINSVGGVLSGAGAIPMAMPDNAAGEGGSFEVQSGGWALYYSQWRANPGLFGAAEQSNDAISGMTADPDNDGVPNVIEYLSGDNPRKKNGSPLTIAREGGGFVVSCKVDAATLTACEWKLRHSEDLVVWADAATQPRLDDSGMYLKLPVSTSQPQGFWRIEVLSVSPAP